MAKTKEELEQLRNEFIELSNKLSVLSDDELIEISGGNFADLIKKMGEGLESKTGPVVK